VVDRVVTLFLCGDVMLGRGVDQILPHSGDPTLHEHYAGDARTYVELAEAVNGPIPRPVGFSWPWGDALPALDQAEPDTQVINLETSITRSDAFASGKAVHYRMSPGNVPCLTTARPDVCVLGNNHVLDFGHQGLAETLDSLSNAGLRSAGAGRDLDEARRPATVAVPGGGRIVVFSCGMASSGIPTSWAAMADRAGVDFLLGPSEAGAAEIIGRVRAVKRPGDVVVVSVHWGSNWGYDVVPGQVRFAHQLIDQGVDVIHGHSSHHPRPIEIYEGKVILYGCGDFIDDYEGITGYEEYRDDLRLLYFVSVEADTGRLAELRVVPMQARRMRLHRACGMDVSWVRDVLDRVSRPYGTRADLERDGVINVRRR
jgi:poly-gamma-glutamate synthesis protein (capsule biosynthesis protein)